MLKRFSGIACFVTNLEKTISFYKSLGFTVANFDKTHAIFKLGDFTIRFLDKDAIGKGIFEKEALAEPKGSGIYIDIEVKKIDEYYKDLKSNGIVSSEPKDWPWGRREFVLRDPDGYKLVFVQPI